MRTLSAILALAAVLPAQALACTYERGEVFEATLYYELGASNLATSGNETLQVLASNFIGCEVIYIASGHIDASELDTQPQLGQARAEDARQRLLARDIPGRDILVRDMKHDAPPVATAPGVREPRNRIVELLVVVR